MNLRTYRAKTMQEAIALVRRELGPKASVLHTREVRGGGLLRWLSGSRLVEVVASTSVSVPSRLPPRRRPVETPRQPPAPATVARVAAAPPPASLRNDLQDQLSQLQSTVEDLCRRTTRATRPDLNDSLFRLFADLIEADVSEELARDLIERVRQQSHADELSDCAQMKTRLAQIIEEEIPIAGPIQITPGRRHLVALVGPTGVGKTTTIAKLAANYRLREKRRVGLITVDTYRIAAVEQLRSYADIIDLPMEIVATPREMHQAMARMADLDLILMDTAGRSPRDEVKIQELKSMLAEAVPDEVHLVLSSVASASSLSKMAEQFAAVGTTALVLTKLDEAASLGNLLPLVRSSRLPLSYLTHGQNVPDDIAPADRQRLARIVLGLETVSGK
ncbi:MAG: flagellar biosynthesis protein FlhF [Planctomycetia bacterium]|nr:flagellar biosynthesis protein FlhF [Planctomycetia bacterium]